MFCLAEILVDPESRLVPKNTHQVFFYCKIRHGSQAFWKINNTKGVRPDQILHLKTQGFYIIPKETHHDVTTLTLMANVTEAKSGSKIRCSHQSSQDSKVAVLLIIGGKDHILG